MKHFRILHLIILISGFSSELSAQTTDKGCIAFEKAYARAEQLYEEEKYLESTTWFLAAVEAEEKSPAPNPKAIAKSLGNAGYSFDLANQPEKALECYNKGLGVARKASDSTEISIALANIGQLQVYQGKHEEALKNMQEALTIERALKNDEGISINLNSIGKIFESWNRPQDAISFYNQALELDLKNKAWDRVAIRYSSLGSVYRSLKDYPKAIEYQHKALEIERKSGNQKKIAIRLDRLGEIYLETRDWEKADRNFQEALAIFRSEANENSMATVLLHLGQSKMLQKQYEPARAALTECLRYADKLKLQQIRLQVFRHLSVLLSETGQPEQALRYLNAYISLKDSVFNAESQAKILEFREKYETEKKEKEIAILTAEKEIHALQIHKNRQQKAFLIGGSILLLLVILLIYSRYRIKQRHNLLLEEKNTELRLLNATKDRFFAIIAHDLRNPVSAFRNISGSLMKNIGTLSAAELGEYVESLNREAGKVRNLLLNLLDWAKSQLGVLQPDYQLHTVIPLVQEVLDSLGSHPVEEMPEIRVEIPENTQVFTDANMLKTILRNFISNALHYTPANGMITIAFLHTAEGPCMVVRDTGSGIRKEDISKLFRIDAQVKSIHPGLHKGSGLGLILCHELTQKMGGKIKVESEPGKGSEFFLFLPEQAPEDARRADASLHSP